MFDFIRKFQKAGHGIRSSREDENQRDQVGGVMVCALKIKRRGFHVPLAHGSKHEIVHAVHQFVGSEDPNKHQFLKGFNAFVPITRHRLSIRRLTIKNMFPLCWFTSKIVTIALNFFGSITPMLIYQCQ